MCYARTTNALAQLLSVLYYIWRRGFHHLVLHLWSSATATQPAAVGGRCSHATIAAIAVAAMAAAVARLHLVSCGECPRRVLGCRRAAASRAAGADVVESRRGAELLQMFASELCSC